MAQLWKNMELSSNLAPPSRSLIGCKGNCLALFFSRPTPVQKGHLKEKPVVFAHDDTCSTQLVRQEIQSHSRPTMYRTCRISVSSCQNRVAHGCFFSPRRRVLLLLPFLSLPWSSLDQRTYAPSSQTILVCNTQNGRRICHN